MVPQQQRFVYDKHTSYKVPDEGLRKESSRANVSSVAGWTKSKTRSAETMFQQGTRVHGQVVNIRMFERPDR